MAVNSKDTIYVDVDDEITTIIDKVRASDGRIVALVLPKRATVFQSVVNMKLLKRSAEAAKKHVVLVTTESSLMPLAGAVGLHVAPSPQSKPEIPSGGEATSDGDEIVEESADEFNADNAGDRPIGELAGATAPEDVETLSLPDDSDETPADQTGNASNKPKKDKHLKVPNFNRFRLRLFLGITLIVLIVAGLYVALGVLPKATIAISTNASNVSINLNPTLDPTAKTLDTSHTIVPAKLDQQQKTANQQVTTTGQKNTGTLATGTVKMSVQKCAPDVGSPDPVPAGTGVSTNGLTFITQEVASFSFDSASGSCVTYKTNSTDITAQNPGTKYNVSNATFSVAGRGITGTGSANGGTDNIIQVVAQADIDSAKQKLATQDTNAIKSALEQALRQDGMYPLPTTFNAGTPVVATSSNVGDQAANVTVTQAVTYTMYGAKQGDLEMLIKSSVDSQINTKDQTILDDGLASADIAVANTAGDKAQISLQTTASVGPDIDIAAVKKQAAGKKSGDVKAFINNIPGVTNVDVRLSPFWVSTVPTDAKKVTVTVSGTKQTQHGSG